MSVPKFDELLNPVLQALRNLGGSGNVDEIHDEIAKILKISESDLNQIHRGTITQLAYRLAWARNYLKNYGLLENSARGVWALTAKGREVPTVDKEEVKRSVRKSRKTSPTDGEADDVEAVEEVSWKEELLETLKKMPPAAFERLCQRILRESGFTHVVVTGKSGDGGIDGKGVVKIGTLLSFHVSFQCKRYKETVTAPVIRDFRGAMQGRADKGLIITTGTFTRDARSEAQRDGASPIDLIDGEELAEMMKRFSLGVEILKRFTETITVKKDWLNSI